MEKDIYIGDIKVHFRDTGKPDGMPVILMHGWGCSGQTVESIAKILEPSMHVYSLDLPGHGLSDEPDYAWGIEKFTQMVEQFCQAMNIVKPTLIGHSFGGRISILFASRNDVNKVVLVDSAGIKPRRSLKYYAKVYSYKTVKHVLPMIFGKKLGGEMVARYRGKAGSADYKNSSDRMRAVMSVCVNEDLRHVMPSIKASTLLIWGTDDKATPLSDAKQMEKLIPDAGLVAFDGCGHYSFLDNPRGFRAVLLQFLKDEMK